MKKQTSVHALITALALFNLATFARAATATPVTGATPVLPATTPAATVSTPVSSRAPLKMTGEVTGKIDRRFFGANFLYWIENKTELADGKIEALMKNLPVTILRYPGGTVADNFHWKTTTLDNPNRFPYETRAEVANRSTFDDFMAVCARIGAEPMVVVNTESWFLHNDIEGGAKEAADWVRYCKAKNYKVKYWEIGNETYWIAIMTSREYGALVKRYAQAMRAVDPTIIISAVGHWDKDHVGVKERFPRDQWEAVRQRTLSIDNKKNDEALKKYVHDNQVKNNPNASEKDKWWNNVLAECGQDIDMMSVHCYYQLYNVGQLDTKIAELRKYAKAKTGRDYLVCVSEYNYYVEKSGVNETGGWGLAEGVCRMLNAGVELGTFWPMRYGGKERAMITRDKSNTPRYPYQMLKLFSDNFSGGDVIKCASAPASGLFLFAAKSPGQITLVVVAHGNDKKNATEGDYEIAFDADAAKGKVTSVSSFATDAKATLRQTTPAYTLKKNGMSLRIVPGTFTMITIKRQPAP